MLLLSREHSNSFNTFVQWHVLQRVEIETTKVKMIDLYTTKRGVHPEHAYLPG